MQRLLYFASHRRTRRKSALLTGNPVKHLTIAVLGCMAERMKERLLLGTGSGSEAIADVVAGPDAYRNLPMLLETASSDGSSAVNVQLSRYETYADVPPVRRKGDCSGMMTSRVV